MSKIDNHGNEYIQVGPHVDVHAPYEHQSIEFKDFKYISIKKSKDNDNIRKKVPHIHADSIIQWAKDTSQVVEYYHDFYQKWVECQGDPGWNPECKYRFVDGKSRGRK